MMAWLKTILDEAYGLFVDDGSFAVAIPAVACRELAGLATPGPAAGLGRPDPVRRPGADPVGKRRPARTAVIVSVPGP